MEVSTKLLEEGGANQIF